MKKIAAILLALLLIFALCGCGNSEQARFAQFVKTLAEAQDISFTAKLRAEYADMTAQFTLDYVQNADGCTVEITEPKLIAGIRAHVDADGTRLEYEGAVLDIGKLTDDGLTPMSALPLLMRTLREAGADTLWFENELLAVQLMPSDNVTVKLWIDPDDLVPQNAEIAYKGQSVVFVQIENWRIN